MVPILCNVGLFASATGSNLLFRQLNLYITANKHIDGVIYSLIGLTAAALALLVFKCLLSQVSNVSRTSVQEMRARAAIEALDRRI
jgi:hypothetical protein